MDVPTNGPPTLAHWKGDLPVYPASVPKFAYLMAVYHWRDQGELEIDKDLDRQLTQMVYSSSNRATQKVVSRLTDTQPGPRLEPEEYARVRRETPPGQTLVQRAGHHRSPSGPPRPTTAMATSTGATRQFLEDTEVEGSLPDQTGQYRNRAAMTANGSAELLALLATDRALSPETSAEVRERMRRTTKKQSYLTYRITGGAERCGVDGVDVFAKTGTWGPIYARRRNRSRSIRSSTHRGRVHRGRPRGTKAGSSRRSPSRLPAGSLHGAGTPEGLSGSTSVNSGRGRNDETPRHHRVRRWKSKCAGHASDGMYRGNRTDRPGGKRIRGWVSNAGPTRRRTGPSSTTTTRTSRSASSRGFR